MVSKIDEEQASTVDKHFKEILEDDTSINQTGWNVSYKDLPDWFDADLFKRSQEFYKNNMLGFLVAALMGLIDALSIPSVLKILIFTKKSGTPCAAYKRYAMTILHLHHIYSSNIKDCQTNLFESLRTIRWKHCKASKLCKNAQLDEIKNRDLALVQWSLVGYILIRPKEFGLNSDPNEQEAFVHFWRVIGHLIGIPDRLNVCRKNVWETQELCEQIIQKVMIKNVESNPPHFREMTTCMIKGISCIDFSLDERTLLYIFYKMHNLKYEEELSIYSRLNIKYREVIFSSFRIPIIGQITRSFYNVFLKLMIWMAGEYPILAWLKFGKNESQYFLYPKIPSTNCKATNCSAKTVSAYLFIY